jgi:hypothetical protein
MPASAVDLSEKMLVPDRSRQTLATSPKTSTSEIRHFMPG